MKTLTLFFICFINSLIFAQNNLEKLDFLIGSWNGEGSGFGNSKSVINSDFNFIMNGKYVEVRNESKFESTEQNPGGEHHIDKGFISFDKIKSKIVYRQFNIEGYVNQYILSDSLSNDSTFVFETEEIENFALGGKARWTINKIDTNSILTIFDVSFPGKEYSCFGTNKLNKME